MFTFAEEKRNESTKMTYARGVRTHGMSRTATYRSWRSIKGRCLNKNFSKYKSYGDRGIVVCDRWVNSFENFLADMGEKPKGMSIDRIDNNGNYEPGNCRWANDTQQANNRRTNVLIKYDGKTKTLAEWARMIDINYNTLKSRLDSGWSVERALSEQPKHRD